MEDLLKRSHACQQNKPTSRKPLMIMTFQCPVRNVEKEPSDKRLEHNIDTMVDVEAASSLSFEYRRCIYSDLHQQKFQSNRIFFIIMTDLFNHHEQQFGNLSAEITARICKIPNLHGCKFRSCSDLIKFTLSLDQIAGEWNSLPQFNFPKSIVRWFFLAAKKSAVTDVERCFDEARELVSNFVVKFMAT